MPGRPAQHVIGDKAVSAVSARWIDIGAAVEEVKNDYGEDLLVQTVWEGEVDSSKVWVQVKGCSGSRVNKSGVRSISVSRSQAMRWASISDVIVVVLWDVSAQTGWYVDPKEQIDLIELVVSGRRSVRLHFPEDSIFSVETALKISWQARVEHFLGRCLVAREVYVDAVRGEDDDGLEYGKNLEIYVLWEFLCKIGLIGNDGVPGNFVRAVRRGYDHSLDEAGGLGEPEEHFYQALTLIFLHEFHEVAGGVGLPMILIAGPCDLLARVILAGKSVEVWVDSCSVIEE